MRVAYLCHRIPYPPDKGEKIRAFHQLRALAAHHSVDLFTLADDPADRHRQDALLPYCRQVHVASLHRRLGRLRTLPFLLTRTPLTVPYFYSRKLARWWRQALATERYDRIFVYCSAMAQYVPRDNRVPVITDLVDVDSDKWTQYASHARLPLSLIYRREGRRLQELEELVSRESASVVVTTEREACLLRSICPAANIHVISNGVDTEYFAPPSLPGKDPAVVFTGDMSYFPNEEAVRFFAAEVLPLIRQSCPETQFLIVGRNPGPNVKRLEECGGVQVTGFVPDIRPWLARAQVSVAPFSIAAGIPNKILEAMACGLPVVGTSRAVQGLSPATAAIVSRGETAEELAAKVVQLLQDSNFARAQGLESRRRVGTDYNWDRSGSQLLDVLQRPSEPAIGSRIASMV